MCRYWCFFQKRQCELQSSNSCSWGNWRIVEEAVKIVGSGSGVARRSVEGPACSPFNFVRQLRHTYDPSMRSSPNTFCI